MQKSATMTLRIDPETKRTAENVLDRLGVSMSTAIDMFLKQVAMTGSIPFKVALPEAPRRVNADAMDAAELRDALLQGVTEAERGAVHSASEAFAAFRKAHFDAAL